MRLSTRWCDVMWCDTSTAVDLLFSALSSQPVTPEQPTPLAPGPRRLTLVPHLSLIAPDLRSVLSGHMWGRLWSFSPQNLRIIFNIKWVIHQLIKNVIYFFVPVSGFQLFVGFGCFFLWSLLFLEGWRLVPIFVIINLSLSCQKLIRCASFIHAKNVIRIQFSFCMPEKPLKQDHDGTET